MARFFFIGFESKRNEKKKETHHFSFNELKELLVFTIYFKIDADNFRVLKLYNRNNFERKKTNRKLKEICFLN